MRVGGKKMAYVAYEDGFWGLAEKIITATLVAGSGAISPAKTGEVVEIIHFRRSPDVYQLFAGGRAVTNCCDYRLEGKEPEDEVQEVAALVERSSVTGEGFILACGDHAIHWNVHRDQR